MKRLQASKKKSALSHKLLTSVLTKTILVSHIYEQLLQYILQLNGKLLFHLHIPQVETYRFPVLNCSFLLCSAAIHSAHCCTVLF